MITSSSFLLVSCLSDFKISHQNYASLTLYSWSAGSSKNSTLLLTTLLKLSVYVIYHSSMEVFTISWSITCRNAFVCNKLNHVSMRSSEFCRHWPVPSRESCFLRRKKRGNPSQLWMPLVKVIISGLVTSDSLCVQWRSSIEPPSFELRRLIWSWNGHWPLQVLQAGLMGYGQ